MKKNIPLLTIPLLREGNQKQGLIDLVYDIGPINKMAEIGCYAGESMDIFAQTTQYYYAIDLWENGFDDDHHLSNAYPMYLVEEEFDKRIKENNIVIIKMKMTSARASLKIPDNTLDFVYIDANHKYSYVKEDILLWLPKIKKNRAIGGHDFYGDPWGPGVSKAVCEVLGKPDKTYDDGSWIKFL